MNSWINFKELRGKLNPLDILKHYKVAVKVKGDQAQGFCPLPTHNGSRKSPSFSVNLKRNIWRCFGCQKSGNLLDLILFLEILDPNNPADVRKGAVLAVERFCPTGSTSPLPGPHSSSVSKTHTVSDDSQVLVNAPLDFTLKGLDPNHPYLAARGFTPETIEFFGLGFCSKGLMKDRIAIPLHDPRAHLVGYAGRVVDDALIAEDNPKYRFPGDRKRDGKRFKFRKSLFVYNGFRISEPVSDLVVVEGFASVWWLWQNGQPNVVALMGANCSGDQAAHIVRLVRPDGRVWLLTDGDEAGEHCAVAALPLLATERCSRWRHLELRTQPTDLTGDDLRNLCKL